MLRAGLDSMIKGLFRAVERGEAEEGAPVYMTMANDRVYLGVTPPTRVRGSDAVPVYHETSVAALRELAGDYGSLAAELNSLCHQNATTS